MIKSMNIAWWVQRWNDLQPGKVALIYEGQHISYADLHRRANRVSCWLQSLGIEKGDRVAVVLANCPEFIEVYLACSRLGAIFVPLNFRAAAPELDYFLKNSRPRLLVFGSEFAGSVEALDLTQWLPSILLASVGPYTGPLNVFDYESRTAQFDGGQPFLSRSLGPADPEEPQVVMYTSGTTGQPKGAVLTHRKTFFNCLNSDSFFKLHADDIMLVVLPLFHSGGLFIQAAPTIYKGAALVIHPKFDPLKVYRDIQHYRVTKFLAVPTIYRALLRIPLEKRGDLSSLKVCAGGSEKTTPELFAQCQSAGLGFRQVMGQTETSILLWASEEDYLRKPGTVGRPVFHAEVLLLNQEGRPVKPGEIGEIVVRGSIMMKEYWQDPVRTEETIKNGYLHTGDLARMDAEGYFYLVDRVTDMYISGGENVYPAEVERVLQLHPAVEEAVVVGVPNETWGEVGHAFIIPKDGARPSDQELIDFCRERLAGYKCPAVFTFCRDLPRTSLGKVKKEEFRMRTGERGMPSDE